MADTALGSAHAINAEGGLGSQSTLGTLNARVATAKDKAGSLVSVTDTATNGVGTAAPAGQGGAPPPATAQPATQQAAAQAVPSQFQQSREAAMSPNNNNAGVNRSHTSLLEGDPDLAGLSARERRMAQRRCIAEDPEWNLALVEKLSELCVRVIVSNFEKSPQLSGIPVKYRDKVLGSLSVDLPLQITANLIPDESYWQRCATSKFKNCDVKKHGGSWKRLFFELHVQKLLESFVPKKLGGLDDFLVLQKELRLASPFVQTVEVRQLKPTEPAEGEVVKATDPPSNHVDTSIFFSDLTNLRNLSLYYGVQDCGMNFNWMIFGMTMNDCMILHQSLKTASTLESLSLQRGGIDDDRIRLLASALLENKTLAKLDVSHNKIADSGARGIAKMLASPCTVLKHLNLGNNKIGRQGAYSMGKALQQNTSLEYLNLRMNVIGDEGGASLCASISKVIALPPNSTTEPSALQFLDLSSNNLGFDTVTALCYLLKKNGKSLKSLDLSCNKLGNCSTWNLTDKNLPTASAAAGTANGAFSQTGTRGHTAESDTDIAGKMIFEAISQNKYVTYLDLRVSDISQENMVAIKGIIAENSQ
ncbi:T-complex-associated testis-expressed protein 1 [Blyttiomyces sp. JEL0837]|nr:T-complex-associated testis-expressed protein 1 [Blyttiomyces sp. JEL0837]